MRLAPGQQGQTERTLQMAIRWAKETEQMLAAQTPAQKLSLLENFLTAWRCPDVPEGQSGAISAQHKRQIIDVVMAPGRQCDDLPNVLLALCEARSRFESISPMSALMRSRLPGLQGLATDGMSGFSLASTEIKEATGG